MTALTHHFSPHQYIDRETERLIADPLIRRLYSRTRENAPLLFRAATSRCMSAILGFLNFDLPMNGRRQSGLDRLGSPGIDPSECLERPGSLNTARRLFDRRIRYWQCRPMPRETDRMLSPADARMIAGSFDRHDALFHKGKFFCFDELVGVDKPQWLQAFKGGDFALLRLTPDKYHYDQRCRPWWNRWQGAIKPEIMARRRERPREKVKNELP